MGQETKKILKKQVEQIKHEITNSTSDYDKEKLQERLAKACRCCCLFMPATETELKEKKKYRVEDAVNATKQQLMREWFLVAVLS